MSLRGAAAAAAAFAALLALLVLLDQGALAGPPSWGRTAGAEWARTRSAPELAATAVRVVATAGAAWGLAASVLQFLAAVRPRSRRLRRIADRVTPLLVRRVVVAAGVVATSTPAPAGAESVAVMRSVAEVGTGEATAVMRLVAPPVADRSAPGPAPVPSTALPVDGTYTVQPGDSFWSIAEARESDRLGRPATDREVLEPWVALVEANLDRLVEPGNPDLIVPGQQLRLSDGS